MAAGLSAALERIAAIVEGCDTAAKWRRSTRSIASFRGTESMTAAGIDHKYWLGSSPSREQPEAISGSHHTQRHLVALELARYWGQGDRINSDYYGLLKSLEAEALVVEHSLLHQNNWDYTNTGIILINLSEPSVVEPPADDMPVFLWSILLELTIRQASAAVVV